MSASSHGAPFEPFFLPAPRGERFCIFHPAAGTPRGAIVYLHPFTDEMNRSRRMAALQSREFATRGYAVLQIDLFGCGDSSGDFGEARWHLWKQDVESAVAWIAQRAPGALYLWGLRLGALLALDYAADAISPIAGFVIWQPLVSGEQSITQFLRLKVANDMISTGAAKTGTQALRQDLGAGNVIEVAGYDIAPELVRDIDRLKLSELAPRDARVHWLEVIPEAGRPISPAARRVADAWLAEGAKVDVHAVPGAPFWNTIEITTCPELIAQTTRALESAAP